MERKFKVGDRVRIRQWDDMEKEFGLIGSSYINCACYFTKAMKYLCGKKALIKGIEDKKVILVFDDNCGAGWNFSTDMLESIKNECIVIYRKGQEVIALNKATGEKAVAKCCPEDTFDFKIGSKLAFERLMEEKQVFLEEFEKDKIYVFRKELAISITPLCEGDCWVEKCDGKVVDVKDSQNGWIDGYEINPIWCEEIGFKKEEV